MGRLDRHLLRTFVSYWVVLGAVLIGLQTVLSLVGSGDELAQSAELYGSVLHEVARYYGYNTLVLLVQFAPYLSLLAALATVIQVGKGGEWIPMLASGRSTLRAVTPLFFGAAVLAVGVSLVRDHVVPKIAIEHEALERKLFNQRQWRLVDAWARTSDDRRLRAGNFLPNRAGPFGESEPEIEDFEVFQHNKLGEAVLVRANRAVFVHGAWELEQGRQLVAGGTETRVDRFEHPELRPRDLLLAHIGRTNPLNLSTADLKDLLARDRDHRQAATFIWAWRAAPLTHLLLLLLCLPFTLRLDRRSALEGLARGLLLCMLYFVADFILRDLGGRGVVGPFLGGVGALILFSCVGLWAVDRLPT